MNLFWPCYKLAFNVKMELGWSISTKHFLCQVTIAFLKHYFLSCFWHQASKEVLSPISLWFMTLLLIFVKNSDAV